MIYWAADDSDVEQFIPHRSLRCVQ